MKNDIWYTLYQGAAMLPAGYDGFMTLGDISITNAKKAATKVLKMYMMKGEKIHWRRQVRTGSSQSMIAVIINKFGTDTGKYLELNIFKRGGINE